MGAVPIARSGTRVLLVEDNPADAALLTELLQRTGIPADQVSRVSRCADAIARLRDAPADVILLDLHLPDGRGSSMVQRIRHAAPTTPLILITTSEDASLMATGADDFLSKFDLDSRTLDRSIRHAMQRQRLQSELREIVWRSPEAILIVGRGSVVRFVNPAAEQLFGCDAEHLLGSTPSFALQSSDVFQIPTFDGSTRHAEVRVMDMQWLEEPAMMVAMRDISDRIRAEQLQRRLIHADKLASIGQMSAGIAHEINNPAAYVLANLTVLNDLLDELRGKQGQDEAAEQALAGMGELLTDCVGGMDRIRNVVSELKMFSRIERDDVEEVDINQVVEAACHLASNEIRHRARLVKSLEEVPMLRGDAGKLTQVVVNLLINAAQAIDGGDAAHNRIEVRTCFRDRNVFLSVSDSGSGIDAGNLSRIFEPFFTTKTKERGTGLGLALVAELVRVHDGEVDVDSSPERGTCFTVRLPLRSTIPSVRPPVSERPSQKLRRNAARAKVLLIDDDPALRRALKRMLGAHHDVTEADGGRGGIDALGLDAPCEVVLCDLMMPDVDGPAVYEHLKSQRPDLLPRLAFLSGGAFTPRVRNFLDDTDIRVVEKPVSREALLEVISELLGQPLARTATQSLSSPSK